MVEIRCDMCSEDSVELTEEQIADVLQFDGTTDLSLPWGEVYGGIGPHYAEIYVNAGDLLEEGAWLTRESFEGLRRHLTEIVQIPRHEVRPWEKFSHGPFPGDPVFTALDPLSRYWMDSDFLPAASNGGGLMDTRRSDMVYVRRPKEVKPDRLAGLRKVFPDADCAEHGTAISCVIQTTLTLETLLRLQEEYPDGEIAIEADGNRTVGIFVDGV